MAQSSIGTDSMVFILVLGLFSRVEKILACSWLCMCVVCPLQLPAVHALQALVPGITDVFYRTLHENFHRRLLEGKRSAQSFYIQESNGNLKLLNIRRNAAMSTIPCVREHLAAAII